MYNQRLDDFGEYISTRFEVLKALKIFIVLYFVMASCSLVGGRPENRGIETLVLTYQTTQCYNSEGHNIVTCKPIARERLGKHIPAATNTQATIG
jgi:hypothetical protein